MILLITVNMLSNQRQLSHSIFVISMELRMSCHTVVNVTGHTTQHGVKVTPIRGMGTAVFATNTGNKFQHMYIDTTGVPQQLGP